MNERIPNAERAVIAPEKLRDYLLNREHRRGGSKAMLLYAFGYRQENWDQQETDLRSQHLTRPFDSKLPTEYGDRYDIVAALRTPNGRELVIRSIWQIDAGSQAPRLITMVPESA